MIMKVSKIFLLVLMISIVWVNWKLFDSMRYQAFLSYEFNRGTLLAPIELFERFDNEFPNLNQSSLPISYIRGRYYQANDSLDEAINLYHKSLKVNPYLMAAEAALAEIYLTKDIIDSAYYYANKAYYNHPNVGVHRRVYFDVLERQKDSIELMNAFKEIKSSYNKGHWMDYISVLIKIVDKSNPEIENTISELESIYPEMQDLKIMRRIASLGQENVFLSTVLSEEGTKLFQEKKYENAISHFEAAIIIDDSEYSNYENAALSYFLLNQYDKATDYFKKVIDGFKVEDGKSLYYLGFIELQEGKKDEGCQKIRKAVQAEFNLGISSQTYNYYCN